jgi:uncharacterized protein YoaH (UPF0181 family)
MLNDLPNLTHEEQQKAVEKIQELMREGISTAEAIKIVAEQIRQQQKGKA